MEKFNCKPTKPKDASTLIIIRKNKKKPLFLMGAKTNAVTVYAWSLCFPGGVTEKRIYKHINFLN